ncbi:MAG TPA: hypothetical protein VNT51_00700 [Miltoncostaeaceae bacterium]|nr:hypothetical protein [Miltoncostaeaceae bacterium]
MFDVDEDAPLGERDERDEEVALALGAFRALVPLPPREAALAALAVEAVVRALGGARGPDDPTPGMMTVPTLLEDPLARAQLADAAPDARDALGDLERALLLLAREEREGCVARVREAVRRADARLRDAT